MEKSAKSVPLKRLGAKNDVADLALFLASDAASYISGAIIPCDGGLLLMGAGQVG
jgi:NAD(P)-dependent dehydrogenase (short-subunit alcohol dehydrogenase family)